MLRARFAYFKVFKVSSAFVSAGLTQASSKQKQIKDHQRKLALQLNNPIKSLQLIKNNLEIP